MKKNNRKKIKLSIFSNLYPMVFYLTVLLFFMSLGMRMYLTNKLATKGKELEELSQDKNKLERDISKLSLEISSYSSMTFIESVAREKGFVDYRQQIAVISYAPVAVLTPLE